MKSKLARRPQEYKWSSCRANVTNKYDSLIRSDRWLEEKDRKAYKKFLIQKDPETDEKIRKATSTGRPLGSAGFLERIEKVLSRKLTPGKAGRPRKK